MQNGRRVLTKSRHSQTLQTLTPICKRSISDDAQTAIVLIDSCRWSGICRDVHKGKIPFADAFSSTGTWCVLNTQVLQPAVLNDRSLDLSHALCRSTTGQNHVLVKVSVSFPASLLAALHAPPWVGCDTNIAPTFTPQRMHNADCVRHGRDKVPGMNVKVSTRDRAKNA